jgi:3'(2'), 5'-bisphosphate nucleotidase
MNKNLSIAIKAAVMAGKKIMEIYGQDDFQVEEKADLSPLTIADKKANTIILDLLAQTNIPVLSEEDKEIPFESRKNREIFWLVDPLDGTKEFIKRNDEFTVNIALIEKSHPVAGVIYLPVFKTLYIADIKFGSFKIENIELHQTTDFSFEKLALSGKRLPLEREKRDYTIVGSRSHMNQETETYIARLKEHFGKIDFISRGSSLKICMVAEGKADIYPRFGPTMEWDTAAGHAIALAAGCLVTKADETSPLLYNKENLLNPWFIVKGKVFGG